MATTVAVLEAALHADTKAFDRAMGKSESKMQKLGKVAGIAGLAIAGGLAVAFKVGFDEMVASQKVMGQTEAVIKSTGGAANVTAKHVDGLAQELLALSGVDDELIAASENVLLTFRDIRNESAQSAKTVGAALDKQREATQKLSRAQEEHGKASAQATKAQLNMLVANAAVDTAYGKSTNIFDQATRATLDFATAMDLDLNAAALSVGKALNDPIKGMTKLQRQGVTFTEAQEKLITALVKSGNVIGAQKIILAELTKEFGGSAEAAGKTLPAQLNKAREAFADIAAALVVQLLPALTAVLMKAMEWLQVLKEHPKWAKAMVIGLAALSAALLTASVAQIALNVAVLANPYVLIVVSVLAYAAAVVYLANRFDFARKHWQLFLIVLGLGPVVIATVVKAIIRHWDSIRGALTTLRDTAVRVWNAIGSAIRAQIAPLIMFYNWIGSVIGQIQRLIDWIGRIHMPSGGDVGNALLPGNPFGAAGAIVTRPTTALIGEAGPEALIPLNRMPGAFPLPSLAGGGGDINIYANVIGSEREVLQWLERARKRQQRQGG